MSEFFADGRPLPTEPPPERDAEAEKQRLLDKAESLAAARRLINAVAPTPPLPKGAEENEAFAESLEQADEQRAIINERAAEALAPLLVGKALKLAEKLGADQGAGQDGHDQHQAGQDEQAERPRILTVDQYLAESFPPVEPLIGTPAAALLVRGEGAIIAAPGGVGKTALLTDCAFKLALGLKVMGHIVSQPLRVCIMQAEIPGTYYQQRVRQLSEAYSLADADQAAEARTRIHIPLFRKVPDLGTEDGLKVLLEMQQEAAADVLILDPFLPFFQDVDENNNGAVRAALDRLKFTVLLPGNCGAIIADHQAKTPAGQTKLQAGQKGNEGAQEGGNDPRGAGAKRDWCCTLAALKRAKTPEGEHGDFLKLALDKVRYGPTPRDPLTLHRDPFSGRFELWRRHNVSVERLAGLVADHGDPMTKKDLTTMIQEEFQVSKQDARSLIDDAVSEGMLAIEFGKNKTQFHTAGPAYMALCGTSANTPEQGASVLSTSVLPEHLLPAEH